jgi:hypothetical protein
MTEHFRHEERFGHREHLAMAYAAIRRFGMPEAVERVCAHLREITEYARKPQKYHHTVSRAWVELLAYHVDDAPTFDGVIERNPALLDKRLLIRHYRSTTLASPAARESWLPPDLVPFPRRSNPGLGLGPR